MGGGGSQTQRTEPPKYQLPYLQYGTEEAKRLYQSRQPTVAPMSNNTGTALGGIASLAGNNQITANAGDLAGKTLSGGFLGSNPYLDQTFNQAALATQNQLASQFAGAGRNVDASMGLRSQQLNDLATQIYGGAYDSERNRQNQVLAMSPQLGAAQYTDLNQLLNAGQIQEGYAQRQLDAPGNALDQYLGRVSGNMGTTIKTSQPGGFSGSGSLGGAILGNMLFPGIGGMIGGGLLGGLF